MHITFELWNLMKPSWLRWPIIQVCPGLRDFQKHRTFTAKTGKSQANQDKLVTLILKQSGTQIKFISGYVSRYVSYFIDFGMWINRLITLSILNLLRFYKPGDLAICSFRFIEKVNYISVYSPIPWIWIGQCLKTH